MSDSNLSKALYHQMHTCLERYVVADELNVRMNA